MQYRRRVITGLVGLVLLFGGLFAGAAPASATPASSNCLGEGNNNATVKAPADTYDVYVRLGSQQTAQNGQLLLLNNQTAQCTPLTSGNLVNSAWTPMGSLTVPANGDGLYNLVLVMNDSGILQSYNQPSVLLVSRSNPACLPATECTVTVNGQRGVVRAGLSGSNSDTLFIVRAVNPANDKLKTVNYYVNDRLAYTRPTVEPFDLHYVGGGTPTTAIVASYASGQQVVISKTWDRQSAIYDPEVYFNVIFYGQKNLLQYAAIIVAFLLLVSLCIKLIRAIHRRQRWLRDHFADISAKPTLSQEAAAFVGQQESRLSPRLQKILHLGRKAVDALPILAIALLIIVSINAWVIQLNQVDGPSMDSTFASGQTLVVNRLGQTWGHISGRGYIPKRGQVVVFHRVLDVSNPLSDSGSEFVIKRVLGLPGERVVVNNDTVTIYNQSHPGGFQPDQGSAWARTMHTGNPLPVHVDVTLPADEVFVCGDNRPVSVDSRSFGPIQTKDIVGNVAWHS